MSWAAIIAIVLQLIKDRAAAGWPLLKLLAEYFGWKLLEDAESDATPLVVGAAPDTVKDQIIAWLEARKANAGVGLKLFYSLAIRFVPSIADQIWDSLFNMRIVAKSSETFGPRTMAFAPPTEADALNECDVEK